MKIGDKVIVKYAGVFHGVTGEVGEIHDDEVHIKLDVEYLWLLPTPDTENMLPFLNSEVEVLDDTTPVYPDECWIIVTPDDLFLRRSLLGQQGCSVQIFTTKELAIVYIELAQHEYPKHKLEPKHYTWKGIIERFGENWMLNALLDHEYGSKEGVFIPIPRKKVASK